MPTFEIRTEAPVAEAGLYLAPAPPETHEQRLVETRFTGDGKVVGLLRAAVGGQTAHLLELGTGDMPVIRYDFEERGAGLPDWAFASIGSRFDVASEALARQIVQETPLGTPAERAMSVVQFIADRFSYGNRERHLGDDEPAMPAIECDLVTGNCVDMHTLAVAAIRSIGVRAAYLIGGFVPAGYTTYPTGHCWINLAEPGSPHHYDISHHVEYGLGKVTDALNPKPGRRFTLGVGRGLQFKGPEGLVELPSISGFHALQGMLKGGKLRTICQFL